MATLGSVIADLTTGVLVEDGRGHVLVVNQAFCDLLGVAVPAEEWVGARCGALYGSAAAVEDLSGFLSRTRSLGARATGSEELVLRDGRRLSRFVERTGSGTVWLLTSATADAQVTAAPTRGSADRAARRPDGAEGQDGGAPLGPGRRVLVVDDNRVNRLLVQRMLEVLGLESATAENGRQAVDMVSGERFVAVLMDVAMPVLDGHEATRRIRAEERGHRTPVVAITASTAAEDRLRAEEAGMDDFLAKPVSLADLTAALAPWVHLSSGPPEREVPVLETSRLADLEEQLGDSGLVRETVQMFLDELPGRIAVIHSSAEKDDRDGLKISAHSLKSSSAMLGAVALSSRCARLEAMAGSPDPIRVEAELEALHRLQTPTEVELRAWRDR